MAERYTRLYSLDKKLYSGDSPVIVIAGVLLRAESSGNLLCQLRYKNISSKIIHSLKVVVRMLDENGAQLGAELEHQYTDLKIHRDEEFGSRTGIVLPEEGVRSFTLCVTEVSFEGGGVWQHDGRPWIGLRPQQSLEEAYGDRDLADQFRIRYGADCLYPQMEDAGLWFCTCGAVNRKEESVCHSCRRAKSAFEEISLASLRAECADRLASEQAREARDAQDNKRRNRRNLLWAFGIVALLALVIALLATIPGVLRRTNGYEAATSLLNAARFDEAAAAFTSLGDYKDSIEQAQQNVPYQHALYLMEKAEDDDASALIGIGHSRTELNEEVSAAGLLYEAAIDIFRSLGDYKDSPEMIRRCEAGIEEYHQAKLRGAYEDAAALLDAGSYSLAREAFLDLAPYEDSREMAQKAVARKVESLEAFAQQHDVSSLYARLSIQSQVPSLFSLPKDQAMTLGSQFLADLQAACGQDLTDITLDDSPAENLLPLAESIEELRQLIPDAGAGLPAPEPQELPETEEPSEPELPEEAEASEEEAPVKEEAPKEETPRESPAVKTDHPAGTQEFFRLCEEGDLTSAQDWLDSYKGSFPDKAHWKELLALYLPYCDRWGLFGGDSTLLPLTVGESRACIYYYSLVKLKDDVATLQLTTDDKDTEPCVVTLTAELGSTDFSYDNGAGYTYRVSITGPHMAYVKYQTGGNMASSCEYEPSW